MKKPKYNFGAEFVAKQNKIKLLREMRKRVMFGPVSMIVRQLRKNAK